MTAFFIATPRIKDADKFQQYAAKAGKSMVPFGGELLIKGKVETVIAGECNHPAAAIVKFPDMDALNNWYNSADYQAIIPLRDEASDMTLVTYSVLA